MEGTYRKNPPKISIPPTHPIQTHCKRSQSQK